MFPTVLVCTALRSEDFRKVSKCWGQTPLSPKEVPILTEEQAQLHVHQWQMPIFYIYREVCDPQGCPYTQRDTPRHPPCSDSADGEAAGSYQGSHLINPPAFLCRGGSRTLVKGPWSGGTTPVSSSSTHQGSRHTSPESRSMYVIKLMQLNKWRCIKSSAITICVSTTNLQLTEDTMC